MDSTNTSASLAAKLYEVVNAYGHRKAEAERAVAEAARVVRQAEENYSHVVVEAGDEDEAGRLLSMAREKLTRCQERARALAQDPKEYRRALVEKDGPHRVLALALDSAAEDEGRALVDEIAAGWSELAGLRDRLAEGCEAQRGRLLRLQSVLDAQDQGRSLLPVALRGSWGTETILAPSLVFKPDNWPTPARRGKVQPGPMPTTKIPATVLAPAKPKGELPPCAGRPFATGTLAYAMDNAPAIVGVMSTED